MKMRPLWPLSAFSAEMVRRKVYPVVAAYAVIAWILLQIGEVTFEPLGLPEWPMTVLVVIVITGFPVAVVLAWMFDITPSGLRRDSASTTIEDRTDDAPSIAVLPFTDMSPEQDQGYFCEGVAEEILNALTKIPQLHVVARTSAFLSLGRYGDHREMGKELGAKTILEGSVRKSDERLRVTAQLINVKDGYHIWTKTFDEELKDIFAIQDEIATCIAESLLDTLTPVKTTSSQDVVAYEFYLRGRHFFHRFRKVDLEFARQMFRQAIDIDPDFALAWAGYADSYAFMIMYVDPDSRYRDKACEASKRALQLEPDLAEAHASRGLAHLIAEEFKLAEGEFDKALELNPRLFEAYYYYGRTRFHQGDMQKAAELFAMAAEVNPEDYQSRLLRVQILRGTDRMTEAVSEAKQAITVVERHLKWHPDDVRALHLGAGSLILAGQTDRAERWLERALEIDPDDSVVLYNVACNFAVLGKIEKSLDYLERAIENGTVSVDWMRNDTDLDNLREQPRYTTLLKKVTYRRTSDSAATAQQ